MQIARSLPDSFRPSLRSENRSEFVFGHGMTGIAFAIATHRRLQRVSFHPECERISNGTRPRQPFSPAFPLELGQQAVLQANGDHLRHTNSISFRNTVCSMKLVLVEPALSVPRAEGNAGILERLLAPLA